MAGDDRPFCHLVESPLFTLFFVLPRSVSDRYGRASSELGWVSGVCLSTLVDDTVGSEEALIIFWGLTLVAPFWPQRPWFLDLLELVVDGPISLPQCRDLLSQPRFHCHHLRIDKLSLHARRLSSDLLDPRDSPLE